jgi:hypothetical protein
MVLMQNDRDMGPSLHGRLDHAAQEGLARVFPGAGRRLHDHRAIGLLRRLHDSNDLFHVIDVECRHAVALLGRMVEQLSQ